MIGNKNGIYEKRFDKHVTTWTIDPEFNRVFLKGLESYYNDKLKYRGYVFLRDIYEELGFKVDASSIVVGWFYDSDNVFSDNRIDFRITQVEQGPDFLLDFNVDGDITKYFK